MTTLMGIAHPSPELLDEVASRALGRPVRVASWEVDPVPYAWGSPSTAGLFRVRGATEDGDAWRSFCKQLQHPRHWPMLSVVPPPFRDAFLAQFPWRAELDAWSADVACRLPAGLRVPRLHRLVDLGDDRLAVWMEDVQEDPRPWDLCRFVRAARALGGLAARRSDAEALEATGVPVGHGLRRYVENRVDGTWAAVQDDAVWRHELVAEVADPSLREDLVRLHDAMPAVLDHLDRLPQSVPHGDASPQNLLQPAAEPEVLVAIDLSFPSPCPVGFDLGQLLVGLVHAGLFPAARMPEVERVLVPAFVEGARAEGVGLSDVDVQDGYAGALLGRAGFTSLPVERFDEPVTPDLRHAVAERLSLTRFVADRGLALLQRLRS